MENADAATADASAEPLYGFICGLTLEIMQDPVMAEDGFSYERESIEKWFAQCRRMGRPITSPTSTTAGDGSRVEMGTKLGASESGRRSRLPPLCMTSRLLLMPCCVRWSTDSYVLGGA